MRKFVIVLSLTACAQEPREARVDNLPPDLAVGDVVLADDIELEVPAPGEVVSIIVDRDDGTTRQLALANIGGVVSVFVAPEEPPSIAALSTAPCQDDAFQRSGHKWTIDYRWRFNAGSTPNENNTDNVETGIVRAANGIQNSRNDCGLDDFVSATHTYAGRTSNTPNLGVSDGVIRCTARDEANVVGFGPLPGNTLAAACSWWDGDGHSLEGDIRISTNKNWYPLDVPSGCSNRFGIEPVLTHEFGHIFGLGHVSESNHPSLTMSPLLPSCSNAPFTLGLGDVRGLRALY